jgi:hypothetical protein
MDFSYIKLGVDGADQIKQADSALTSNGLPVKTFESV